MGNVKLEDIKLLFRKIIIPFHEIERDTTLPLPSHRPDNDAEHSWSLALLAISLAAEVDKELDVGKVSIFATIHDIAEVYAGDTSVWAEQELLTTKKDRENVAKNHLKTELPQFESLFTYLEKYEKQASNEAKFVYALDKFINLLTIIEDEGHYYKVKHKITKARYEKHLVNHRAKAHTHPVVAEYYDELRSIFDKDPNHFYVEK